LENAKKIVVKCEERMSIEVRRQEKLEIEEKQYRFYLSISPWISLLVLYQTPWTFTSDI